MTSPHSELSDLVAQIEPLSWIPAKQRSLLIYYIRNASQSSTCSLVAQKRYNELLIPMALQNPALLKAMLAWSVGHKNLHSDSPEDKGRFEIMYSELIQSSLLSLQMEIRDPQQTNQVALIAACMMLCMQKMSLEKLESKSWRVHLEGAKVIILAANRCSYDNPEDLEVLKMLNRWYQAIEALAALTARGLPAGQAAFTQSSLLIGTSVTEGSYLDEYCGYAFKLNDILREVGAAAWERRRRSHTSGQHVELSSEDLDKEADYLENSVLAMLADCHSSGPLFYPGVAGKLSPGEIQDFVLCNKAYHHMAFIHIQRRVRRLSPASLTVQNSVKKILECGISMTRTCQSSPWIALTAPFFTAGCDAFGVDRDTAKGVLQALYIVTRSESTQRALSILENFWTDDQGLDYYDWEMLPGTTFRLSPRKPLIPEIEVNQEVDFIPY